MAIEPKDVDLPAVVGLIAANPGEASETVVEGARPHRDRSLSFGSKCAVEIDDGVHRRHPCVKGRTAEGFTMNPRLVEPGFAVVCLHADVPARPGKDENRENDAQVARQHGNVRIPAPPGAAQGGPIASTDRAWMEQRAYSALSAIVGLMRRACLVGRTAAPTTTSTSISETPPKLTMSSNGRLCTKIRRLWRERLRRHYR